jgi:tetratricopeptide (TPR) repeat protein
MSEYSMVRRIVLAAVVAALGLGSSISTVRAQQDVSAELERAQSLYYGAEFLPSIDLLLDLEKRVGSDPKHSDARLKIALYLGLGYVGLNETEKAKAKFVEVCTLDSRYALSPLDFSRKVINLFQDASKACIGNSPCDKFCGQVDGLIMKGDFATAQNLLKSNGQCPCASSARSALIQARFKAGQEFYEKDRFAESATEFAAVLALDETHELANEYLKLSQHRLDLNAVQQVFSEWRTSFDNRQYEKAATAYEKIKSSNVGGIAAPLTTQIESEYQQALSRLVTSWKDACAGGDAATMDTIRIEASTVAPRPQLNREALAEMGQCQVRPAPRGCMRSDPMLAINRLTTRVNPMIDPALQRYVTRGIRVAIQIDVAGNVTVIGTSNVNPRLADALKKAVEQWKFYPAIVNNEPRCVETELPITLIQP